MGQPVAHPIDPAGLNDEAVIVESAMTAGPDAPPPL